MPDAHIRRAVPADLPALTQLWQTAFGDPPELIAAFYDRFPPETAAWVVEDEGRATTAAHLLGGKLHTSDGAVRPCTYVYAVSTAPERQGRGYASTLMRRFAADADAGGCILYTLPAEPSLYGWYQTVMGTTQTARGERLHIKREPDMRACRTLNPSARRNTPLCASACCMAVRMWSCQRRCWHFRQTSAICAAVRWCASAAAAPLWSEIMNGLSSRNCWARTLCLPFRRC